MKRNPSLLIRNHDAGDTVLSLLVRRFTYRDRDQWLCLIRDGRIRLNGRATCGDRVLSTGDILAYTGFDTSEPPVSTNIAVVYEDPHLAVVNKPGNLPCHPGGRYFDHTLWHQLQRQFSMNAVHFVNRLDRETSGLVLVAKTPEIAKICCRQFESGHVKKHYLVMVEGEFSHVFLDAGGVIVRDTESRIRKKQRFIPHGSRATIPGFSKYCRTLFRRIRYCNGMSLVSAAPVTGRLHQIRATLFGLGYPVVGDKIYGVDDTLFLRFIDDRLTDQDLARLRLSRQALHAQKLEMRHPVTGLKLEWHVPLPTQMADLMA